jgi:transcriptional regulator with XRE-family HTH domain
MADGVPGRQHLTGYRLTGYGDTIAKLRQSWISQGLSQRQIAERIGSTDRVAVQRWLAGGVEPFASNLFALADALGYDLALIPREGA